MKKIKLIACKLTLFFCFLCTVFSCMVFAKNKNTDQKTLKTKSVMNVRFNKSTDKDETANDIALSYTVIPRHNDTVYRNQAYKWLQDLQQQYDTGINKKLAFISGLVKGIPYQGVGANGEGDWDPNYIKNHKVGALHINQEPAYRTDTFNCQTLVTLIMALLASDKPTQLEPNIIRVNYGSAHIPGKPNIIHYYNRNNFISVDFNPVNEQHGYIKNITTPHVFPGAIETTKATITRKKWFAKQADTKNIRRSVRVFDKLTGDAMVKRLKHYPPDNIAAMIPGKEKVSVNYIPLVQTKSADGLFIKQADRYVPNKKLFSRISHYAAPAVIEIVRDTRKWSFGTKNVAKVIGSQLVISHMGLIYNQHFAAGNLVEKKIDCQHTSGKLIKCAVDKKVCSKSGGCRELMLLQATDAYPNSFVYWQDAYHHAHCTSVEGMPQIASKSMATKALPPCNRVITMTLQDYLAQQLATHKVSLLGVHFEKITL